MMSVFRLVSAALAAFAFSTVNALGQRNVLSKDVVIVGGGAAGAHAAVRLHEDYGKTVALIEKQAILGGHVDSYTDPETGLTTNYGVQSWIDQGGARAFFSRLGVPVKAPGRVPTTTRYVDFSTGKPVNFTAPAMPDQLAALARFRDVVEPWEDILQPGYFDFPLNPEDVPEDLLLPFGEFARKHGIEEAVPRIFGGPAMGTGNIVDETTLYVVQAFGAAMARSFLGEQQSIVPESGRNQDLYDAVAEELGDDVLYSSTVVDAQRSDDGVVLTVKNSATNGTTVINARRLLMAIEPTAANLAAFHPDEAEKAVFSRFRGSRIYAGVVAHEALPVNVSLNNIPSRAAAPANDLLAYPEVPFQGRFDYVGTGSQGDWFRVLVVGDEDLEPAAAKALVQGNLERLIEAGTLEDDKEALRWLAFEDHGAMHLRVSADEVREGFIQKQYALQGRSSTWWTGGAFSVQFQTALWDYNDVLLEKLVADLDKTA